MSGKTEVVNGSVERWCEDHGNYIAKTISFGDISSETNCEACAKQENAAEKDREIKRAKQVLEQQKAQRLAAARIPLRFTNSGFENYVSGTDEIAEKIQRCKNYAETFAGGTSLILCGTTGTGKTHLGISILKQAIDRGLSAKYSRAITMMDDVKETYNRGGEKKSEVIVKYTMPEQLILDEIGLQFGSDTEKMILFEILNERYEQMKSTVIISNLDMQGLTAFMGERVLDRMKEGGGMVISFNWESRRGRA